MSSKRCYVLLLAVVLVCLPQFVERAQGSSGSESVRIAGGGSSAPREIRTCELSLYPKAAPDAALEYVLGAPYIDQRPGNGAALYDTALSIMTNVQSQNPSLDGEQIYKWCDIPVDETPLKDIRSALLTFESTIHYTDLASRCEYCVWEYPVREEGLRCQMPKLIGYRNLARLLILKIRVQMADGDVAGAVDTLRIGMSLGKDVGNGPFVIQGLVGIGIDGMMLKEMRNMVQSPDTPNLYWALTTLPKPLIDMHKAMQVEYSLLYLEMPELRTLEKEVWSNEQALKLAEKLVSYMGEEDHGGLGNFIAKGGILASAMKSYPDAKKSLLERGMTMAEVEAMTPLQVILIYKNREYRRVCDMQFKWTNLPFWQAREGLKKSDEEAGKHHSMNRYDIIARILMYTTPAIERISFIRARFERDLSMMQCVEAIRMYAAGNDGRLPKSLGDITEAPVPIDPVYGRAFSYKVAGDKAVLESPAPEGGSPRDGMRFEITLKKASR